MRQKIIKCDRFGPESDDPHFPSTQILLALKTPIHGQQYVKSGSFRGCEKFAILEYTETRVPALIGTDGRLDFLVFD